MSEAAPPYRMEPLAWETLGMDKTVRSLQVETLGYLGVAYGRPLVPRVRIRGQWLERAGFPPGSRVTVELVSPGILTLRSAPAVAS